MLGDVGMVHTALDVSSITRVTSHRMRAEGPGWPSGDGPGGRSRGGRSSEQTSHESTQSRHPFEYGVLKDGQDPLARLVEPLGPGSGTATLLNAGLVIALQPDSAVVAAETGFVMADSHPAADPLGIDPHSFAERMGRLAGHAPAPVDGLIKPSANGRDAHARSMP